MIPTFLHSLAALIRKRVASGQAVHVTEQTATELELLAELPWRSSGYESSFSKPEAKIWIASITLADLALGWLVAAHVDKMRDSISEPREEQVDRAAVCAELAVLAERIHRIDQYPAGWIPLKIPDGTREGARAMWGFIVARLNAFEVRTTEDSDRARAVKSLSDKAWAGLVENYRRELEAMK
jgi:hypothetical protein